jgi:hypothetical protein
MSESYERLLSSSVCTAVFPIDACIFVHACPYITVSIFLYVTTEENAISQLVTFARPFAEYITCAEYYLHQSPHSPII